MQLGSCVNKEVSVTSLYTFLQMPCDTVWLQALQVSPAFPGFGTVLEALGSIRKADHRDSQQSDL